MAYKRMVMEVGMGTDLHGADYTKAAVRALKDALWHNSLTIAPAFGIDKEEMKIEVSIGVAKPEEVDADAVKAVLPYGKATVEVVEGRPVGAECDGQSGHKDWYQHDPGYPCGFSAERTRRNPRKRRHHYAISCG